MEQTPFWDLYMKLSCTAFGCGPIQAYRNYELEGRGGEGRRGERREGEGRGEEGKRGEGRGGKGRGWEWWGKVGECTSYDVGIPWPTILDPLIQMVVESIPDCMSCRIVWIKPPPAAELTLINNQTFLSAANHYFPQKLMHFPIYILP